MFRRAKGAEILSVEDGVIQMPGREFPAIAIQGDALWAWRQRVIRIASSADAAGDYELVAECKELFDMIDGVFRRYNRVCITTNRGGFTETDGPQK